MRKKLKKMQKFQQDQVRKENLKISNFLGFSSISPRNLIIFIRTYLLLRDKTTYLKFVQDLSKHPKPLHQQTQMTMVYLETGLMRKMSIETKQTPMILFQIFLIKRLKSKKLKSKNTFRAKQSLSETSFTSLLVKRLTITLYLVCHSLQTIA